MFLNHSVCKKTSLALALYVTQVFFQLILKNILNMKGIVEDPTESAGFGCAVTNRFGQLLDNEADPFDIIRQAQVEKQKKKDELKRTDTTSKPVKKESQKDKRTPLNAVEGNHSQAKNVQGKSMQWVKA